jgi:DNA-binding XRE family transcriptional regulator
MEEHIKHQIVKHDGKPLYVLVPYSEYLSKFAPDDSDILIPHEVVGLHAVHGKSLVRAWREYLKLSQKEVAERIQVTQAAYSQMENSDNLRLATLEKIAAAFDIDVEQLTD